MLLLTSLLFFSATAKVVYDSPHDHLYCELHPWWLWDCSRLSQSATACQTKWSRNKRLLIKAWESFLWMVTLMQWTHRHILESAVELHYILCSYWSKGSHLGLLNVFIHINVTSAARRVETCRGADRVVTRLSSSNYATHNTEQQGEKIQPDRGVLLVCRWTRRCKFHENSSA